MMKLCSTVTAVQPLLYHFNDHYTYFIQAILNKTYVSLLSPTVRQCCLYGKESSYFRGSDTACAFRPISCFGGITLKIAASNHGEVVLMEG